MKLLCDLEIAAASSGATVGPSSRARQSIVAAALTVTRARTLAGDVRRDAAAPDGRSVTTPQRDRLLLVLFTKKSAKGIKYELEGNVERIFGKFADSGKATIRLVRPQIDLCVSRAKPASLKAFLTLAHRASARPSSVTDDDLACGGESVDNAAAGTADTVAPPIAHVASGPARTTGGGMVAAVGGVDLQRRLIIDANTRAIPAKLPPHLSTLVVGDRRGLSLLSGAGAELALLDTLEISGCALTALPPALFELARLTTLRIRGNRLAGLPDRIGRLSALAHLDARDNAIDHMPRILCALRGLSTLRLGNNRIAALPSDIGRLTSLRHFDIGDNALETFPRELFRLSLKEFRYSGNPLKQERMVDVSCLRVPSLFEACARAFLTLPVSTRGDHMLAAFGSTETPPFLVDALERDPRMCARCGKAYFGANCVVLVDCVRLPPSFASQTDADRATPEIPVEFRWCSWRCAATHASFRSAVQNGT